MAGFGFLRQMSETFKYNRDLLGKPKREPFDNGLYKNSTSDDFQNERKLTEQEEQELIARVRKNERWEIWKRVILLISIIVALVGLPVLLEFIF